MGHDGGVMSKNMIHPTACVDSKAELGRDVTVGPYCCVGPGVVLGDGCQLRTHVTIEGRTTCGAGNIFFAGCVIGSEPQDLKYHGGPTQAIIGDDNVFREHVTMHLGTETGGGITRVGSHNRFMVGSHIAHDADVGSHCILANCVQLAGHVRIEDKVVIGGVVGIHHFTTIGMLAYIGGMTRITQDVPPFMMVEGHDNEVRGFNETGMRRWKYTEAQIRSVREAYLCLFGKRARQEQAPDKEEGSAGLTFIQRLTALESRKDLNGEVRYLCDAIRRKEQGVRGRWLEKSRRDSDADRANFYQSARREN